jgi:hypothetical protein
MRRPLLALLLAAALAAPAGCGSSDGVGPRATRAYDPRDSVLGCIHGKGLQARKDGRDAIQVGARADDPRIVFEATSGEAEAAHLRADAVGAEVIGDALLYVRGGSDSVLHELEDCLD